MPSENGRRDPAEGPDGLWSPDLPPSPGQWEQIACLALDLLGLVRPVDRREASIITARMIIANTTVDPDRPKVPEVPADF